MWTVVLTIILLLLTYFYLRVTRKYGMFQAKGIKEPPKYFPFGTAYNWKVMTGRAPFFKCLDDLYKEYGQDYPVLGTFANSTPVLVVNDLDLAKDIMIKNFDHFTDRRTFELDTSVEANLYTANMLTMIKGEKWKKVRSLMSPAFTSGKLKAMVPLIQRVGDELVTHLEGLSSTKQEFSVRDVLTHYTLDCIATCGFGVEANSFKDPSGQFRTMVLQATGGDKGNKKQMLNALIGFFLPRVAKFFKLTLFDEEAIKFLANVVKSTVAHRRKEKIRRGDLIDIVLEALDASEEADKDIEDDQFEKDALVHSEYKLPKDEIETILVANAIILFFAGFEATSTTVGVTLGYLSKLPDIQEKLFQEINDAMEEKGTKNLDYETVQSLPYLDKVFHETLRYYFTASVERVCTKDYRLPRTEFVVPEGMVIQIPSSALHRDPKFYPDPDNFNPDENFSPEAKAGRSPYSFLSFGQGPRNCIGMRFALLMAKMCLARVVGNFRLSEGPSMPKEFVLSPFTFSGVPQGGIYSIVERR